MLPLETREHLLSVIKTELADLTSVDFDKTDDLHLAFNSAERLFIAIKRLKEEDYHE